jgi:hypothetical protein
MLVSHVTQKRAPNVNYHRTVIHFVSISVKFFFWHFHRRRSIWDTCRSLNTHIQISHLAPNAKFSTYMRRNGLQCAMLSQVRQTLLYRNWQSFIQIYLNIPVGIPQMERASFVIYLTWPHVWQRTLLIFS